MSSTTTKKTPFPSSSSSSSSFRPFPLHNPSSSSSSSSPTPLPPLPPPPPPPSSNTTTNNNKTKPPPEDPSTSSDGPTVEVVKRPRGRPPGSKNKPKTAPPPTSSSSSAPHDLLRPHILEIPSGHDVAASLSLFSRRRDLCVAVLAATGPVSNVTLRNTSSSLTFHGRFDLLSLSATFLPPSFSATSPLLPSSSGVLSVSLAGPQGHVVGGLVSGPLLAAGTVTVFAAAFSSPTFHRLPANEELSVSVSVSADGTARSGEADGSEDYPRRRSAEMAVPTSSHLLSDVIWRGQHTPPYQWPKERTG